MEIKKIIKYAKHRPKLMLLLLLDRLEPFLSDELFLKIKFRIRTGKRLNIKRPTTFCEKLQWLKLHNQRPEYTEMVDKVAAKDYVKRKVGTKYIIPTLGVWNSIEEIEWENLPKQFVIKVSSDSGGVVICKDKDNLDIGDAIKKLGKGFGKNYYRKNKEYPYRNVKPRIIAEQLLDNGTDDDLPDYKFYCFNGSPKYCQVIKDRRSCETIDFYDMDWHLMPFVGLNPKCKNALERTEKPVALKEMIRICEMLSEGIPFVRVDLYLIQQKVYFGELTFFPGTGMGIFSPEDWNVKLGQLIEL